VTPTLRESSENESFPSNVDSPGLWSRSHAPFET
jgi:hypothetical protein